MLALLPFLELELYLSVPSAMLPFFSLLRYWRFSGIAKIVFHSGSLRTEAGDLSERESIIREVATSRAEEEKGRRER